MTPYTDIKVAEEALKGSKDIVSLLNRTFNEHTEVIGTSVTLECPTGVQEYTTIFKPMKAKFRLMHKDLSFPCGKSRSVELKMISGFKDRSDCIIYDDKGFILNIGDLEDEQEYQLIARYDFDKRILNRLVDRVSPRDSPHMPDEQDLDYELNAQLKYPKLLSQTFSDFNIKSLDLNVSVAVHEDVKLAIPSELTNEVEALVELSKKKGRDEKWNDFQKLMYAQNTRYGGKGVQLLRSLSNVFTPPTFRQFINVDGGFSYLKTERGREYYTSVPFPVWPVNMNVISETNLSIDKPASNGVLTYKRGKLVTEIKGMIGAGH